MTDKCTRGISSLNNSNDDEAMIIIFQCSSSSSQCRCFSSGAGAAEPMTLYKVGYVHRHLLYLGVVERFNVLQCAAVINCHEVDGYTLTTKPPAATNSASKK